jgi:hypothetical protein
LCKKCFLRFFFLLHVSFSYFKVYVCAPPFTVFFSVHLVTLNRVAREQFFCVETQFSRLIKCPEFSQSTLAWHTQSAFCKTKSRVIYK